MTRHHDIWHRVAGLIGAVGMAAAMAGCGPTGNSSVSGKPGKVGGPGNSTAAGAPSNPSVPSDSYHIGSMASEFLQSKARLHILDDDDKVAPRCAQKRFVKVDVVSMPTITAVGSEGVTERKWVEQWTIDRCGASVPYHVFFTEVGNGGAYIAVLPSQ